MPQLTQLLQHMPAEKRKKKREKRKQKPTTAATSTPEPTATETKPLQHGQVASKPAARSKMKPVVTKGEQQRTTVKLLKKRTPRGAAVIISRRGDVGCADLIRRARIQISLGEFWVNVARTRYTQKDYKILELQSGEGGRPGNFAAKVVEVLRDEAEVCQPQRITALLILGIDRSATEEETRDAICGETDRVKVISRGSTNRGSQTVKVLVDIPLALEALQEGSVVIGWSRCRLRSLEQEDSAPRC